MKKTTIAMVMLTVLGLAVLTAGIAQAGWVTCSITYVGSTGTGYLIKATSAVPDPTFTDVLFVIDPWSGRGKEMYAAALTAFASSTNVQLFVEPPYEDYTVAWGVVAIK